MGFYPWQGLILDAEGCPAAQQVAAQLSQPVEAVVMGHGVRGVAEEIAAAQLGVPVPVLSRIRSHHGRAEQALRPMVVTRKVWGGNRTAAGARTQSILLRILQTCRQHQRPVLPLLERLLCSPRPRVLDWTTPRPLAR